MQELYIGTYTNNNALIKLSFDNGKLCYIKSYHEPMYCSYLKFKNEKLYFICENKKWADGFIMILDNNTIKKNSSYGINPCYINVGNHISICNYDSENICLYDNLNLIYNYHIKNSLPHCIQEYRDNLIIVDKNNRLLLIDRNMNLKCLYNFKGDTEPRHITIADNVFYIISEKSNELFIFQNYKLINSFKISNGNGCAIKIYKNYLFTSARETNLINVFDISNKTNPKLIQTVSSYGKNPRDMDFYKNFLLVCNVDSDNISIFKLNKTLKYQSSFHIKKPFCISFKK